MTQRCPGDHVDGQMEALGGPDLLIFSDFGSPSGASLVPFWGAKEPKKGTLFLKGSQEGPWEGLGSDFKWIWEVFRM